MKRVVSVLLVAVLLLGFLPMGFQASASEIGMRDLESGESYQNMTTSQKMIDLIKDYEGFSATPYADNTQWTVGYGCYAGDINDPKPDMNLTKAEAEALLREEIVEYEEDVNKYCKKIGKQPNQHQFDALVDLTYNIGARWTTGSAVPDVLENDVDALTLVKGFGQWCYSNDNVSYVHCNRRIREALVFLYGEYYRAYGDQDCQSNVEVVSNHDLPHFKVVIFQANGGTFAGKDNVEDYYEVDKPYGSFDQIPTRDGYELTGWQITRISNSKVDDGGMLSVNDIVEYNLEVKAIWAEAGSQPTEPEVTEPAPTEPAPTEPEVTEPEPTEPEVTEPAKKEFPFTDVAQNAWYRDEVEYVYGKGYMNGTSATKFSPDGSMSRGMLVTVLYRAAGQPKVTNAQMGCFKDVADDSYYAKAVAWAAANGIVNGTDENAFEPNRDISRQEAVTVFYRYCVNYLGMSDDSVKDLSMYADADQVSGFAYNAVCWAVDNGLLNGVAADGKTYLRPISNLNRAEGAALIHRVDLMN